MKEGYYSRKHQTTFRKFYGHHTDLVHTFDTSVSHICLMVCSLNVTYDWFPVILGKLWRVPHVGQEILTLSGTPDITPFGEFMILPIRYIYIVYYWICLRICLRINDSGLFAWISLAALARTYCIMLCMHINIYILKYYWNNIPTVLRTFQ